MSGGSEISSCLQKFYGNRDFLLSFGIWQKPAKGHQTSLKHLFKCLFLKSLSLDCWLCYYSRNLKFLMENAVNYSFSKLW